MDNIEEKPMSENDRKKEYLKTYRRMVLREKSLEEDIQELRANEMFPGAVKYTDMPKGGNRNGDLSDYAVKISEKIEELKEQYYAAIVKKLEIKERIRKVSDTELQEILELRYIHFYSWEKIAAERGYTYRHVLRLHGEALKKFRMS